MSKIGQQHRYIETATTTSDRRSGSGHKNHDRRRQITSNHRSSSMFRQLWQGQKHKGCFVFLLIAPFQVRPGHAALVGCPALLHNLADFAVVLPLVLAEQSGSFWVCWRIRVWITQQGLQSKFSKRQPDQIQQLHIIDKTYRQKSTELW